MYDEAQKNYLKNKSRSRASQHKTKATSEAHTLEKLNQELEYKIKLYRDRIRLQQEQLQQEQARFEKLEKQLQQTRDNLDKIKQQYQERVAQLNKELEILENFFARTNRAKSYEELFGAILEYVSLLIPCDLGIATFIENNNCNIYLTSNRFVSATVKKALEQQLLTQSLEPSQLQEYRVFLKDCKPEKIQAKQKPIETIGSQFLLPIKIECEDKQETLAILSIAKEKKEDFTRNNRDCLEEIAARSAISIRRLQVLLAAEKSKIENEKIRADLEKERELNNVKLRFVRTISHEYRTPLTVISLASDLLEKRGDRLSEEQRLSCWRKIRNGIEHMYNLAEDVLLLERVETKDIELDPVKLDLVLFCYQLVEDLQFLAEGEQKIEFSYSGDRVEVCLDRKLLRQVLTNLLSNALKYSPEDSKIDFELTFAEEQMIFCIRDRGIGIPPQELPKLFEPFHRAENVSNLPGTGLGLAIVKKALDLQRGEITVESELGIGSTFTVKLPFQV
ncbi:MAG: sensor histidine kinase [Prochloraceae cyanobacterium]